MFQWEGTASAAAPGAKAPQNANRYGTTEVVPSREPEFSSGRAGAGAHSTSSHSAVAQGGLRATSYEQPSEADRYEMIRTYFQMLIEEELPDATGKMKQFASWFTHGVPGGAALRKEIYESKTAPEILSRVENFFEQRLAVPVGTI